MSNKKLIVISFFFFLIMSHVYAYSRKDYTVRETEQCRVYVHNAEKYVLNVYFYPNMKYARFYFKVKEDYYYDVSAVDIQEIRRYHVEAVSTMEGFYHFLIGQEKLYYQKSYFSAYEFIAYFED